MPQVERSIGEIDEQLRGVIRSLVAGQSPWPLFLYGPAGTGKTCAALCVMDHVKPLMPSGMVGEYFAVATLCSTVIDCQQGRLFGGTGATIWPQEFWKRLATMPLLVMDELGARENVSDAHYEAVKLAVDVRIGRPLIVISNLPPKKIEAIYDQRIMSRLAAGTVFELAGKDRRLE